MTVRFGRVMTAVWAAGVVAAGAAYGSQRLHPAQIATKAEFVALVPQAQEARFYRYHPTVGKKPEWYSKRPEVVLTRRRHAALFVEMAKLTRVPRSVAQQFRLDGQLVLIVAGNKRTVTYNSTRGLLGLGGVCAVPEAVRQALVPRPGSR